MKGREKSGYIKCMGAMLCIALLCFNSGEQMSYIRSLSYTITGEELDSLRGYMGGVLSLDRASRQVAGDLSESLGENTLRVNMMGIPIKQVSLSERTDKRLMPGGVPVGVSIYADGVLVVGLGSVKEKEEVCPAAEGGIRAGDVIIAVNGEKVKDSLHLSSLCAGGGDLNITVRRDDDVRDCRVTPLYDGDAEAYLAGMWVRDSTSGIGTLSFWDMEGGRFGALGHPITDMDTGSIIDVKNGSIIKAGIIGISAGTNGSPGEMIGSFSVYDEKWGEIDLNCEYGIYGDATGMPANPLYHEG